MTSNYQMWLTFNNEKEKIQFPVLPPSLSVNVGSKNTSVDIAGLGEIIVKQGRPAISISFSSFFPAKSFTGVQVKTLTSPAALVKKILQWKDNSKPVHFIVTGTAINMFCVIDSFPHTENGGDVGTIHYTLALKEYREVAVRKVKIKDNKATAPKSGIRTDNRVHPKTYKVVKGDCLWNIAKKYLGSGNRWKEIYNLNRDIIKNSNLIYPGQVLKLPT